MDANAFAALLDGGIIDDPWLDGQLRIDLEPVVITPNTAGALAEAACVVLMMLDEAIPQLIHRPELLGALGFDPSLAAVASLDAPRWLAFARVDVFEVEHGLPQVCEVNCDTPTGLAETTELNRISMAGQQDLLNPSAGLERRWTDMVKAAAPASAGDSPCIGLVDPTEMTEDLGHIRLITRWLQNAGMRVVRGSPFNLTASSEKRLKLLGEPIDVLVRHYKTDWWARRRPMWINEAPPPSAEPLYEQLSAVAQALEAGTLGVVNPFGSAMAQSKRALALPWEAPDLFKAGTLESVVRYLPESRWLESLPHSRLLAEREDWVLKGDFGCEGDEVILGRDTDDKSWAEALTQAAPGRWLVQRAFFPRRDHGGRVYNHGIYMIGGRPSGIYTRRSLGATNRSALGCPTLIRL